MYVCVCVRVGLEQLSLPVFKSVDSFGEPILSLLCGLYCLLLALFCERPQAEQVYGIADGPLDLSAYGFPDSAVWLTANDTVAQQGQDIIYCRLIGECVREHE